MHQVNAVDVESDQNDVDVTFAGTGQRGALVLADMPHQREACSVHSFTKMWHTNCAVPFMANKKACRNCYCYVCEVKALECEVEPRPQSQS